MTATYDWPEAPPIDHSGSVPAGDVRTAPGPVSLDRTDPKNVRDTIEPKVGREVAELIGETLDAKMKALGLDKPDRRHLAFPEAEHERNVVADIYRKAAAERNPLQTSMDSWFRWILFGRDPGQDAKRDYFGWMSRTLSSTDSEGGYLIPPGYIAEVVRDVEKISELFQWVRRIPVGVNAGEIPKVSTNASVSWGTENTAMSEGDPVFGSSTWSVNRMNVIVKLSREIANDTNPGIVDTVTQLFREKIMEERDRVVAVGTGSGQPLGISGASASTGINDLSGSITAINYSNAVAFHETVDHRYFASPSTRWVMNQTNKSRFMDVLDSQGRPIFQVDPMAGFQGRLLGHPVAIENSLPNTFMFFGDLRYYYWFDRETLGVERSTQAGDAFAAHQIWIKFWERADGKPIVPPTNPMVMTNGLPA